MKYVIEFDLPDNDTVLNNIKTAWVGWNVWGYSGIAHAKPKQPERKTGKWIDYSDEGYVECPFCHSATNCDSNKDELHYCFSCGAELRGEQE